MYSLFGALDLVVFGVFLGLSVLVGVYHAVRSQFRPSQEHSKRADYLSGGRKLPILPVMLSLLTTFTSGIGLLAVPSEIYLRGFAMGLSYISGPLAFILVGRYFIPVFYKLKFLNAYEYFEWRFDSPGLRRWGSAVFMLNTIIYMAVVIYAPAVALNGVTHVALWPFITVIGLVGTFYTTLGGIKAVIWTDTLQAIFLFVGLGVLVVKGTLEAGGFTHVIELNEASGHLLRAMARFHPTLLQYNSAWVILIGGITHYISLFGLNQMSIQRYCSMPSLRDAKIVMSLTLPAQLLIGAMTSYVGLMMVAYFAGCDPMALREVSSPDQLSILMAMRVLGGLPGLTGMFLATLFSATLSTISSGMNSMTAVLWEDFLAGPAERRQLSDRNGTVVMKAVTVLFGLASTGLAFAGQYFSGIFWIMFILGATSGPIVGLFFLGIFFPRANRNGAWAAMVISTALLVVLAVASQVEKPYENYVLVDPRPYAGRDGARCMAQHDAWANGTLSYLRENDPELHFGRPTATWLSRLSPFCYSSLGLFLVLGIGIPLSWLLPQHSTDEMQRLAHACTYAGLAAPIDEKWRQREEVYLEQLRAQKLSIVKETPENGRLLVGFVE